MSPKAESAAHGRDSDQLVQYLTKEIELATEILIQQRTRNNLTTAFGPFILLGGYLVAGKPLPDFSALPKGLLALSAVGFVSAYGFLGWIAGIIERRLWNQCNVWRSLIAERLRVPAEKILFDPRGLVGSYLGIYISIGLGFFIALYVLSLFSRAT
jgi:hypothetical protein